MKTSFALPAFGAIAFVLLSGFGACGKPTPERAKRYVDYRIDDKLDDLKATPEQKKAIHAQIDQLFPEVVTLVHDQHQTRAQVTDLLAQDKVDSTKLHAIVDERIDAFRAFAHKAVDSVVIMHDALNPTQRATLVSESREYQKESATNGW